MTQIQEPLHLIPTDPMIPQMNPNLNIINQINLPNMMQNPLNMPMNGNYPMAMPLQMPNNTQNLQNIDSSNYIFFNLNIIYYYRKT